MSRDTYLQDAVLVAEFQSGNREPPFTQLMEKHLPWVYNLALSVDQKAAEDLCQEIFLRVYLDLPKLRSPQAFVAWLRKLAWRTCKRHSSRLQEQGLSDTLVTATNPWNATIDNLILASALARLKPKQRQVVVLSLIYGFSDSEIADTLKIPLGTVKSRLHTARQLLQAILMQKEGTIKMEVKERIKREIAKRIQEFNDSCIKPVEEDPSILDTNVMWWHNIRQVDAENNAKLYGITLKGSGMRMTRERIQSETLSFKEIPNTDWGIPDHAQLIDIRDVSRRLLVSPFTILKWVKQGMPCIRYYPWRRFDLDMATKWLVDNKIDVPKEVTIKEVDDMLRWVLKEVQSGHADIDETVEVFEAWLI